MTWARPALHRNALSREHRPCQTQLRRVRQQALGCTELVGAALLASILLLLTEVWAGAGLEEVGQSCPPPVVCVACHAEPCVENNVSASRRWFSGCNLVVVPASGKSWRLETARKPSNSLTPKEAENRSAATRWQNHINILPAGFPRGNSVSTI